MSPTSTWAKITAAIPLVVLALATPPLAHAATEITVQNGVISACNGAECIRYIARKNPDGLVSFIKLGLKDTPNPAPAPSASDPAKQALEQLLKDLLQLPNTCLFCDLTKKQIWDDVVQEWLRKLGIKEVPGSGSLVCPNKDKVKALLDAMADALKATDSLRELLDLTKRLKGIIPSDSSDEAVKALKKALEALEERLRELQNSGADDATKKMLIDEMRRLLWKLIFGERSEIFTGLTAMMQSIAPDGSGIARTPEECVLLAGTDTDGMTGQVQE